MNVIETSSLTRRFGDLTAVDGLNLSVGAGEVFGLLGPNGAGKTTVIKMLTTLLPPTSGQAKVAGFDVQRRAARVRAQIGYVPQLVSVDGTLTGYENLLIFAKLYGVPRSERQARIAAALEFVGLGEAAHRQVRGYSGGMMRRLEIALAMLHRPRVLFLDEPTVRAGPGGAASGLAASARAGRGIRHDDLSDHAFHGGSGCSVRPGGHHEPGRVAALGRPEELKISIGKPEATLDEVFAHYTGHELDNGGNYREISRTRRTLARLG